MGEFNDMRRQIRQGSRVFIQDKKGVLWRATIRDLRSEKFLVHYDGHKASNTSCVSTESVVGPIPEEANDDPPQQKHVSENRIAWLIGTIQTCTQNGVRTQTISGVWKRNKRDQKCWPFQLHREIRLGVGMENKHHLFSGSFEYNGETVKESDVMISFDGNDDGTISVNGHGENKVGVFNLSGKAKKSNKTDATYQISLSKKYAIKQGTLVSKLFYDYQNQVRPFVGEVTAYNVVEDLYTVTYKDGDKEELPEKDVMDVVLCNPR